MSNAQHLFRRTALPVLSVVALLAGILVTVMSASAADPVTVLNANCSELSLRGSRVVVGGTVQYAVDCSGTAVALNTPIVVGSGLRVAIVGDPAHGHPVVLDGQSRSRPFIVDGGELTLTALTLGNGFVQAPVGTAGVGRNSSHRWRSGPARRRGRAYAVHRPGR